MKHPSILIFDNKLPYLYTNLEIQTGGIAVEWLHWLAGFDEIGAKVGVLTIEGFKKNLSKKTNFEIIETYNQSKGIPYIRFIFYRLPKLYAAIKRFNPHMIAHAGTVKEIGLLAVVSKLLKKTFIHRISSDADVDDRLKDKLSFPEYLTYKFGIKLADYIYCQNKYQYFELKKKYPKKKIAILKNPYKIVYNSEIFTKLNRSYFAWVGSFSRIKNLQALLNVAIKCPNLKFKIAGKEYPSIDTETLKAISNLKKCNNVEFVGYISNEKIYNFFQNAYALLNTSLLEGFSNTFLEAWSVGTPIISTNKVNPDNIITDFDLGFVSDSYDGLEKKIYEMINLSEIKYKELSERCLNYVKNNHNVKNLAQDFVSIASGS